MSHAIPTDPTADERPTLVRYMVLAFLAAAMASAYLTRVISAAATTIAADFGLSDTQMGFILGGFALGYLWFQVPGGWFGSWAGARRALPVMSILWSGCAAWTAMAHTESSLWWSRVGLGLLQGGLIPTSAKVIADWFPVARRGLASGVVTASMQVGGLAASGLTALLLADLGWRNVFLCYSLVGLVWAVAFYWFFRDLPAEHPLTNQAERVLIDQGRPPVDADGGHGDAGTSARKPSRLSSIAAALVVMLLSGSMWAMCLQGYFRAFSYAFLISWFPAFLEKSRGVHVAKAGLLTMAPLLGAMLGSLVGGVVVDFLQQRTGNKWISRSLTAAVALSICALSMWSASLVEAPGALVAVLSIGTFSASLAGPATWAATIDISGRYTAVVTGVMNMIGNVGTLACAVTLGFLFDYIQRTSTTWNMVLYVFVGVNLMGALCWLLLNPNRSAVERPTSNPLNSIR